MAIRGKRWNKRRAHKKLRRLLEASSIKRISNFVHRINYGGGANKRSFRD